LPQLGLQGLHLLFVGRFSCSRCSFEATR
jgi:hypothetical protein